MEVPPEWYATQETCPHAMCRQEVWPWGLHGHSENYTNQGRFGDEWRTKKTSKRVSGCYATLGAGFVPNFPGLRGKEKAWAVLDLQKQRSEKMIWSLEMSLMRLMKVEKWVETKMIQALEVGLYQSPKNKRSGSLKIHISACVYI